MIDSTILSFVLFLCAVYIIHFTYAYVIYPQICCTFWTANEEYLYTPTCLSSLAFSFFHAGPSFYLVYFPSAWRAFFNMCFSSCLFEMSISPLFLKDSFDEYRLIHRFFFSLSTSITSSDEKWAIILIFAPPCPWMLLGLFSLALVFNYLAVI